MVKALASAVHCGKEAANKVMAVASAIRCRKESGKHSDCKCWCIVRNLNVRKGSSLNNSEALHGSSMQTLSAI